MQAVPNIVSDAIGSNPMTQIATEYALKGATDYIGRIQIDGYAGKIFSPEIRAYFDVDTDTVRNKILKLILPFRTFEFDDKIKKLDLYLPIVSFMTLIMFSTLLQGIQSEQFTPKIANRTVWILIFTMLEVLLAKFTQNTVSHLNLDIISLISLVSYRFVSLSFVAILLVVTSLGVPGLRYIGAIYALIVDTYYCNLQLSNQCRDRFQQEGLGNRIALIVHLFTTVVIMWYCSILF